MSDLSDLYVKVHGEEIIVALPRSSQSASRRVEHGLLLHARMRGAVERVQARGLLPALTTVSTRKGRIGTSVAAGEHVTPATVLRCDNFGKAVERASGGNNYALAFGFRFGDRVGRSGLSGQANCSGTVIA